MKPLSTSLSKVLALTAIILGGLVVNYLTIAWTGPTATAPGINTPAPINAGSGSQTKTGDLTVDGNLVVNSAASVDGLTSYSDSNLFYNAAGTQSFEIKPGYRGSVATADYTTLEMPGADTLFVWDNLEVENQVQSDQYCDQAGNNCVAAADLGGSTDTARANMYCDENGNNCFYPENINNRQQLYLCPASGDLNCGSGCTGGLSLSSTCTLSYRDGEGRCRSRTGISCSATGFYVVK